MKLEEQQSVRNAHASQEFWSTSVQKTTICREHTCFTEILGHFSIENNNLSGTRMLHGNSGPLYLREKQSVRNTHASQKFWGHFSIENNNLSGTHMLHKNFRATSVQRTTICQERTCFTGIMGPLQFREQQSVRNAYASQEFGATFFYRTTVCQEWKHMLHTNSGATSVQRTTICQERTCFTGILEPLQFREQQCRNAHASQFLRPLQFRD